MSGGLTFAATPVVRQVHIADRVRSEDQLMFLLLDLGALIDAQRDELRSRGGRAVRLEANRFHRGFAEQP